MYITLVWQGLQPKFLYGPQVALASRVSSLFLSQVTQFKLYCKMFDSYLFKIEAYYLFFSHLFKKVFLVYGWLIANIWHHSFSNLWNILCTVLLELIYFIIFLCDILSNLETLKLSLILLVNLMIQDLW